MLTSFSLQKSTQHQKLPSFWGTTIIGDDQGLELGLITSFLSISCICLSTSFLMWNGCRYGCCRAGRVVPVSMICLVTVVRPMSPGPFEKRSEFSSINCWSFVLSSAERSLWLQSKSFQAGMSAISVGDRLDLACRVFNWQ